MLTQIRHGPETGHPLLIVHGLFGSARNWGVVAKRLSAERPVITVDLRNHGDSPWTATHSYPDLATDLAEVIDELGGSADVVGHSMGGKAAMALALTWPEKVSGLVVADIAPVAYDHTQMPLVEAMRRLDLRGISRRSDANAALAEAIPDSGTRAFLLQSLDLSGAAPRWKLNLDTLATDMPLILGWPEALTGAYNGPTLFLSGALSDYVARDHRDTIRSLFPSARFAKIPGAGHWLHADKPREFEAAVEAFLNA